MLNITVLRNKFNYYRKYLPLSAKVQLTDRKLLSGQKKYSRFIILGRTRTGSNLMMTSLNSHPNVLSYGEIFNIKKVRDWDIPAGYRRPDDFINLKEYPVEFIRNRIFRPYPDYIKAVGFKIFYFHIPDKHKDSVWELLRNDPGLKIIHMKRKNILRAHLSHIKAVKTQKFVDTLNKSRNDFAVNLDYDECLKDFQFTRKMENEYEKIFEGHEIIDIYYENLHLNFAEEIGRAQLFLGLRQIPIRPQIFKQSKQKLHEAISNYDELKTKFSGTEWAGFFEE